MHERDNSIGDAGVTTRSHDSRIVQRSSLLEKSTKYHNNCDLVKHTDIAKPRVRNTTFSSTARKRSSMKNISFLAHQYVMN